MSQHAADLPRSNHAVHNSNSSSSTVQVGARESATAAGQPSSISRSNRSAVIVSSTATNRRPIPSPLHAAYSYSGASSPDVKRSPLTSPRGTRFPVTPLDIHQSSISTGDKRSLSIGRPRAHTTTAAPEQAAEADRSLQETRTVAARDALLEEAAMARLEDRKRPFATPIHSPAGLDSPLSTSARDMASSSHVTPSERIRHTTGVQRTASIDSTASSISSVPSSSFKQQQVTQQDVTALVQSTGSPDAAILRLLQEKQSVAAHTDQMWRIMEKQRTMIFGLKSDLERALKEKEKYRKRLKEHLALSAAGQSLATALKESTESARADSQSPTTIVTPNSISARMKINHKTSTDTDLSGFNESLISQSSTPQQNTMPANLQEYAEGHGATYSPIAAHTATQASHSASPNHHTRESDSATRSRPTTPLLEVHPQNPQSPSDFTSTTPIAIDSLRGFSSPKDKPHPPSRKAPPAPLNLPSRPPPDEPSFTDPDSVSDYDDEDDEASHEDDFRGRQKTRADDDRQREALLRGASESHGAQKKSKSRSVPPPLGNVDPAVKQMSSPFVATATMASMISHLRAVSDTKSISAPQSAVTSPGLPMSPRPGDRPVNSLMPREIKQPLTGIPMSPRDGGMPLSPRAPKGPIPLPLPVQTPSSFSPPMSARAEAYYQLSNPYAGGLGIPGHSSPEQESPLYNADVRTPVRSLGEVYRGLVSEQYPGFLLPPNALPSIFIKIESSRLRPSRNSYMVAKSTEENPVFTLAIFARSDGLQLWRVEKTLEALAVFDQQIKVSSTSNNRLPDRSLFIGHAPAKIDARRLALGAYFDGLLDTPMSDQAATVVCGFLTADAFPAETMEYFPAQNELPQPIPVAVPVGPSRKHGYLTKRGKNFGGWKVRYFVLDSAVLKYYDGPGGGLLGTIKLSNAQIGKQSPAPQTEEDLDNQYRHAFLVLEPKRKDSTSHIRHVLCAESDDERDSWVDCLLQYVSGYGESYAMKVSDNSTLPTELPASMPSPRPQKSMSELHRRTSSGRDSSTQGSIRAVPYQNTVAAEAPVMGSMSVKGLDSPMPPFLSSPISSPMLNDFDEKSQNHPFISAPKNATVISDVQSWGNRPMAPTPIKDKKRSIFGFGGHNRARAASDTVAAGASTNRIVRPVFGIPLAEAVEHSSPLNVPIPMPAVPYRCIEYLRFKGATSEEGIFRLSGSNIVIKALRERFNTEGDINLLTDDHNYDVHAVASLLKQYLRELPANILTRELHYEFLSTQEREESAKIDACNVLVNQLPQQNRELLGTLTAFLREIVDNERVNKMSVRNVGIVFAPTLNIPATLISLFVTEHDRVFKLHPPEQSASTSSDAVRSPPYQMSPSLPSSPSFRGQMSPVIHQSQQAFASRGPYDAASRPQPYTQMYGQEYGSLNGALAPAVLQVDEGMGQKF